MIRAQPSEPYLNQANVNPDSICLQVPEVIKRLVVANRYAHHEDIMLYANVQSISKVYMVPKHAHSSDATKQLDGKNKL